MTEELQQDADLRVLGRTALMVYRGAREDGSLTEAFWATAALLLAFFKKDEE